MTEPLTERHTRNLMDGKGWPAREPDNFTILNTFSRRNAPRTTSQLYRSSWPVTRMGLNFTYF
jgi:hypothetical protein